VQLARQRRRRRVSRGAPVGGLRHLLVGRWEDVLPRDRAGAFDVLEGESAFDALGELATGRAEVRDGHLDAPPAHQRLDVVRLQAKVSEEKRRRCTEGVRVEVLDLRALGECVDAPVDRRRVHVEFTDDVSELFDGLNRPAGPAVVDRAGPRFGFRTPEVLEGFLDARIPAIGVVFGLADTV